MKIFVLGYNKTGTRSLSDALKTLGYKSFHTGGGTKDNFIDIVYENLKNNEHILTGFEQYDCFMDWPIYEPSVFTHIIDEYPDAKYISLTRNLDGYVNSVLSDKIKRLSDGIYDSWNWLGVGEIDVFENYPQYQKDWIKDKTMFKHISNLRWLDKKKIDYLEMNICDDKDGWEILCKFLNKKIPAQRFPHEI